MKEGNQPNKTGRPEIVKEKTEVGQGNKLDKNLTTSLYTFHATHSRLLGCTMIIYAL